MIDPQKKRQIIGREFIEAFKREAAGIDGGGVSRTGDALSGCD